jgi:teichuronic acid biosynthesis glycosyltransferase TuaG
MISILMPLYNGIEFLDDSITSVIGQTYNDWELLIGVNGHTEQEYNDILNIIKPYNDERIIAHFYSFLGKSKALNELVKSAKYNYICLLDVDDYWRPAKLEKQLPYIEKYDVVGSNSEYFGSQYGSPQIFLGKLTEKMFSYQNPIINSAVMFKKVDANWDEEWEGLDDYNLWIELLKQNKTFYNVPGVLINHRIHKKSHFNHVNRELNNKLLEEKISPLNENDRAELSNLISSQNWEL